MSLKLGNRVTEKDIRNWLDKHDFHGKSARIADLELHAIQRPGWVQLYRFRIAARLKDATSAPEEQSSIASKQFKSGIVLDDERIRNESQKTQIWIFESELEQAEKLAALSEGMLTCRTGQNGSFLGIIAFLFLLSLIAVITSLLG